MSWELTVAIAVTGWLLLLGTWLYNVTRNSNKDTQEHARELADILAKISLIDSRLYVIETKMGLFWHLVEENLGDALAKANPIHLTPDEQAAAEIYKYRKSESPTNALKVLDSAISRELKQDYMTPDEKTMFTLVQGAIRSQLFDRHQL